MPGHHRWGEASACIQVDTCACLREKYCWEECGDGQRRRRTQHPEAGHGQGATRDACGTAVSMALRDCKQRCKCACHRSGALTAPAVKGWADHR